jgi:two-component system, cell cycle sensor histidine kinase and response regulator CckA
MKNNSLTKKQLLEKIKHLEERIDLLNNDSVPTKSAFGQKKAKQSIQSSEELLKNFAENFQGVIFIIDKNGIFQLSEGKGLADLGLEPGQIVGMSVYEVYKDFPQIIKDFKTTLEGQEYSSIIMVGSLYFETNWQPIYDHSGSVTAVLGVALNVTERIESEDKLRESEKKFRNYIENAPFGLFVSDNKGFFTEVNRIASDITGYSQNELMNKHLYELIPSEELPKAKRHFQKVLTRGNSKADFSFIKKDGSINYWTVGAVKISNNSFLGFVNDITESKLVEETLQLNEERFKSFFSMASEGIMIHENGIILDANQAFISMFDVKSLEDIKGKKGMNVLNLTADSKRLIASHMQNGSTDAYDIKIIKSDDSILHVETEGNKINFLGKEVRIAYMRDITDRKQAEESLLKFKLGIERSEEAIFITDIDGTITYANPSFEKIYGYTLDEILGKTPRILKSGELPTETYVKFWQTLLAKETMTGEIINKHKEGRLLNIEASNNPILDAQGNIIGFLGIHWDITDRRNAEEALKQSEGKYRHLVQHSGDAIYLLYNRRFELINEKFEQLFGLTLEEMNKKDFDFINLVAPKSRPIVEDRVKRQKAGEILSPKYEFTALNSKGQEIELEASVTYIKYKDGTAAQGILRDITDRKKLENQLRQSQKMEAVGQLAGGVAHDFNNLLTVINGYCELLALRDLSPDIRDPLLQIHNAGKRATQLTNQLLAFSRKQIIQPKVINLNTVISNQMKLLSRLLGEDIIIKTDLNPDLENIKADLGQIEQIIMNISINGRDAMPFGGALEIITDNVSFNNKNHLKHVEIKPGKYAMISISDNGVGMDIKTQSHIFEPFFTTKGRDKGTGLGLATVYGIVKQNNGYVYVESEANKGTTFIIYLPSVKNEDNNNEDSIDSHSSLKGRETILLVEDDSGVREVTRSALAEYGYNVVTAVDGNDALRLFKNHKNGFDLLLTDVIMPQMSGRELADNLVIQNPELKVLYFSGYTDDNITQHGVLDENVEFIQKPFSNLDLAKKIKDILASD